MTWASLLCGVSTSPFILLLITSSDGCPPRLLHLLNRLPVVVNDVALVGQVGVEEATEDHDLVIGYSNATEL